jgi:hypothetical protein
MSDLRRPNGSLGLTFNRVVVATLEVWVGVVAGNEAEGVLIAVGVPAIASNFTTVVDGIGVDEM